MNKIKGIFLGICVTLLMIHCKSSPVQGGLSKPVASNTYKNIPVEVTGIPYGFNEINGNHTIDYLIDAAYTMVATGQQSRFINFRINKFIYDFKSDGSLILSTVYSYGKTPAGGNSFYPAEPNGVHEWKLLPSYHQHSGGNCSLDRYDDIAVSQAKLNEMKKDPSLKKVYDILLSVAQDMDYDYNRIGIKVSFVTPTPLVGVCDDYSNLLIQRLRVANITGVSAITKVSGQNHAWVTLKYNSKLLYLDATWFDINAIDEKGMVEHTPYKDPRNMTFDNVIFTNHGKHHIPDSTYTDNNRAASNNYSNSYFLIGYNYAPDLPLGITMGSDFSYFSVNVGVEGTAGVGDTYFSLLNWEGQWLATEWIVGLSFPLADFLLLPIGIGGNHSGPDDNKFVIEIGIQPVIGFLYLSATYRLIEFKKSGFTLGAGFVF
jgi:hypothetical protein